MSEELLRSLLNLFAIISYADAKLDDREVVYINSFLEDYLGKDHAKKYRRLFIKYFHEIRKQNGSSLTLDALCQKINLNLDKKQKLIALARLLEISLCNEDYTLQKKELTSEIANKLRIEPHEFEELENFVYATNVQELKDHKHLAIYCNKSHPYKHTKSIQNDALDSAGIWVLRNDRADILFIKAPNEDNEILLNLNLIKSNTLYVLAPGSGIKTGSGFNVHYSEVASLFTKVMPTHKFVFNAIDLSHEINDGSRVLDHVTVSEEPGKLVAVIGGSGSGKTTLLNILSGNLRPTQGTVTINHLDIYVKEHQEDLKGLIGYVAQEDVLVEELTVYQNLYFNAQLCFKGLSTAKIHVRVIKTLKDLGIFHIRNIKVGDSLNKKISGGERKRLNIALELIREPSILLLDEPTSGLSSRDSDNVMDFLKQLSYKGKLIITVIHQPSIDIYNMFDKVLILDKGCQIYYGHPNEAINYFRAQSGNIKHKISPQNELNNPELIFHIVEEQLVDEYGNHTGTRKQEPHFWQSLFKKQNITISIPPNTVISKHIDIPSKVKQFKVLLLRDLLSKLNNRQYLLINTLVAPTLALILAFIVKNTEDFSGTYSFSQNENIPAYIFISIMVSLFMGMTLSAGEIIKDKKLLSREKFLHLSRLSYLVSKLALLFIISAIQTVLFVSIANSIVEFEDMYLIYALMFFSTSCFANILGLLVSSTFDSFIAVYIAIPLLLIPQMILSGCVFSFDRLNKHISSKDKVPILADLAVSRWAYEGLMVYQFKHNKFQKPFFALEANESIHYYKSAFYCETLLNKARHLLELAEKRPLNYTGQIKETLKVLKNELPQLHSYNLEVTNFDSLKKGNVNAIYHLIDNLHRLKVLSTKHYKTYSDHKDKVLQTYLDDPQSKAKYNKDKLIYYNQAIANLVKNKYSKYKIQEYDHRLIQKMDPIYRYPSTSAKWYEYRTHFFSPEKNVASYRVDTYWANLIAIWIINTFFFILLYFNITKYVVTFKIIKK